MLCRLTKGVATTYTRRWRRASTWSVRIERSCQQLPCHLVHRGIVATSLCAAISDSLATHDANKPIPSLLNTFSSCLSSSSCPSSFHGSLSSHSENFPKAVLREGIVKISGPAIAANVRLNDDIT